MANKPQLTAQAQKLGITLDPEWTKAQIQAAIAEFESKPPTEKAIDDTPDESEDEDTKDNSTVDPNSPAGRRRAKLLGLAANLDIPDAEQLDLATLEAAVEDASEERVAINVPKTVTTLNAITVKAGDYEMTVTELAASGLEPRHYTKAD